MGIWRMRNACRPSFTDSRGPKMSKHYNSIQRSVATTVIGNPTATGWSLLPPISTAVAVGPAILDVSSLLALLVSVQPPTVDVALHSPGVAKVFVVRARSIVLWLLLLTLAGKKIKQTTPACRLINTPGNTTSPTSSVCFVKASSTKVIPVSPFVTCGSGRALACRVEGSFCGACKLISAIGED